MTLGMMSSFCFSSLKSSRLGETMLRLGMINRDNGFSSLKSSRLGETCRSQFRSSVARRFQFSQVESFG